jgi:oxygen-independent coproporphyrinogen-3 oxidase
LGVIQEISGIDLLEIQKSYVTAFFENEWIRISNNVLFLTPKGKLFADRIASDLFLV